VLSRAVPVLGSASVDPCTRPNGTPI
jgi:hypothetical protein